MEKESINKIKLGIFVTIAIAIFALGIYYIGETKKLFTDTFRVTAMFKDVNGLQVGNNVRFVGINVGSVEKIQIVSDSTVKVDMVVEENVRKFIKKDSKGIIGTDGMMGSKIMVILPGSSDSKSIEDNDLISSATPISFDDVIATLKETGDNAALITGDLADIFSNIRSGDGTAGKLIYDEKFAEKLDDIVVNVNQGAIGFKNTFDEEFERDMKTILVNINESIIELKALIAEAKDSWLLGSFWGGGSDDDEEEKSEDEKIIDETLKKDKEKTKENELLRLKRIKKLYDEDVLREKLELEAKEKQKLDSLKLLQPTMK